jgi:hypothetical protein
MADRYDDRSQDEMRERGRFSSEPERGYGNEQWSSERHSGPARYSLDDGRIEYDRSASAYRGWNAPTSGYRPSHGFGPNEWSSSAPAPAWRQGPDPNWRSGFRDMSFRDAQETRNYRDYRSPGETRGYYEDDRGRVHMFEHHPEFDRTQRGRAYGAPNNEPVGYSGRGPKGYARSDQRITEDVCDRLADDPHIDASDIEVAVKNGEVTLTGSVHSRHEKRDAEDLLESISGVRDVHNHLRVERWQPSPSPLGINQASATPTATPTNPTTPRR